MPPSKPFRFSTGPGAVGTSDALLRAARRIEDAGYSTLAMADHFMMPFAPLVALQAVAEATSTVRLGQLVLALGFRHPAVLAKELATLDVLSGGRVEIGIGAGWLGLEFRQAGLPFPRPSARIEELEEAVCVLKGLFGDEALSFVGDHFTIRELEGTPKPAQRPHPPIMIGGGGPKLLAVAARHADIVQILPKAQRNGTTIDPAALGAMPYLDPATLSAGSFTEKIEWIRAEAGERFDRIELATMLLHVTITDDVERAEDDLLGRFVAAGCADGLNRKDVLGSPVVAIGSLEHVCDKFRETREKFGLSYFGAPVGVRPEALAPVIECLAGT